jgi:hypothetical protein
MGIPTHDSMLRATERRDHQLVSPGRKEERAASSTAPDRSPACGRAGGLRVARAAGKAIRRGPAASIRGKQREQVLHRRSNGTAHAINLTRGMAEAASVPDRE